MNKPPEVVPRAVTALNARHMEEEPALSRYIAEMAAKYSRLRPATVSPGTGQDQLSEVEDDFIAGEATVRPVELIDKSQGLRVKTRIRRFITV